MTESEQPAPAAQPDPPAQSEPAARLDPPPQPATPTQSWPPADARTVSHSPLNLRLGLAFFGFVVSVAGAITLAVHHVPALLVTVMILIAVTALIDMVIVLRRKFRGE